MLSLQDVNGGEAAAIHVFGRQKTPDTQCRFLLHPARWLHTCTDRAKPRPARALEAQGHDSSIGRVLSRTKRGHAISFRIQTTTVRARITSSKEEQDTFRMEASGSMLLALFQSQVSHDS